MNYKPLLTWIFALIAAALLIILYTEQSSKNRLIRDLKKQIELKQKKAQDSISALKSQNKQDSILLIRQKDSIKALLAVINDLHGQSINQEGVYEVSIANYLSASDSVKLAKFRTLLTEDN